MQEAELGALCLPEAVPEALCLAEENEADHVEDPGAVDANAVSLRLLSVEMASGLASWNQVWALGMMGLTRSPIMAVLPFRYFCTRGWLVSLICAGVIGELWRS